jgi:hypothetical protein
LKQVVSQGAVFMFSYCLALAFGLASAFVRATTTR